MESKYAGMSPYNYSFNNPVMFNDPNGADPDGEQMVVVANSDFTREKAMESGDLATAEMVEKGRLRSAAVDYIYNTMNSSYLSKYDKGNEEKKYLSGRIEDMGGMIALYSNEKEELIKQAIDDSLNATYSYKTRRTLDGNVITTGYTAVFSLNSQTFGGAEGVRDIKEFINNKASTLATLQNANEYTGALDKYKKFEIAKVKFKLDVSEKLGNLSENMSRVANIVNGDITAMQKDVMSYTSELLAKKGMSYLTKIGPDFAKFLARNTKRGALLFEFTTISIAPEFSYSQSLEKVKDEHYRKGLASVFMYFEFKNELPDFKPLEKKDMYLSPYDGPRYSEFKPR